MGSAEHAVTAGLDGAAVVRPGDTLVIALSASISAPEAAAMAERAARLLPGTEAVVISGCTGLAVYRPGREPGAPPADARPGS